MQEEMIFIRTDSLPNIPGEEYPRFIQGYIDDNGTHIGVTAIPSTRDEFVGMYHDIMETHPAQYRRVCEIAEDVYGSFETKVDTQLVDIPLDSPKQFIPDTEAINELIENFNSGINQICESFSALIRYICYEEVEDSA